ncbi:MAG: flagellar motor protein MotB, partial [Oscillospiraceae bacterium]|nr:flagellar motor protein MotB [Oscillospiraceae bacterium]
MARRRGGGDGESGGSWLDTYADMITLILCFFVLLYSMSTMDELKFQYIAQAFSSMGKIINAVVAEQVD